MFNDDHSFDVQQWKLQHVTSESIFQLLFWTWQITFFGCNSTDSDKHKDAHGFMVKNNASLMLPVHIINYAFENNDGVYGGTGLFIDRGKKTV